jgi:hydroxyacylglutathione hydrolase
MNIWTTSGGQTIYQVSSGRCNSFLILHNDRYLLVDPGSKTQWKNLTKRLDELGVNEKALIALILTHSHFDHAENAANIKEKYQTDIIIHTDEADCLQRGDNPTAIQGTTFFTKLMTDVLPTERIFGYLRYKPADYDVLVNERYDLNNLGFDGYLIHTPGHSPGSMSVIIEAEIAIVGDTMFGVFNESVFPPWAAKPREMVKSWAKLLDTGCSIYLPAHGAGRSKELLQRQYDKYKRAYDL